MGQKAYELTDQLGNVRATISDIKLPISTTGSSPFKADFLSYMNPYPFGMPEPGRMWEGKVYWYGYNGKERDDEIKGAGESYDYGFRMLDPRVGRFLSVDPLTSSYPWYTPYQFAGNMPTAMVDRNGLEPARPDAAMTQPTETGGDDGSAGSGARPPVVDEAAAEQLSRNTRTSRQDATAQVSSVAPRSIQESAGTETPAAGTPLPVPQNQWTISTPTESFGTHFRDLGTSSLSMAPMMSSPGDPYGLGAWLGLHIGYALADPPYTLGSKIITGQARHIGGNFATDKEVTNAGVNLLSFAILTMMPVGNTGSELSAARGGLQFGNSGDQFLINASKATPVEGMLDVAVHGNPALVEIGDNLVNHRVLAQLIAKNPEFDGQSIRLISCEAGSLSNGIAQNLANKLGVPVYAPNDLIWAWPNGNLTIGPSEFVNSGSFVPFLPGGRP